MGQQEDRKIARLLLEKGISWNDLSDAKKNLARRVYSLCSKKLEELESLDQQFKRNKFTKSSLATELGVNRRTLATHNPEVSVLVDLLIENGKRYWAVSSQSDKKEKSVLEERIQLLLKRDCELVQKEHELAELKKELEARERQYNDLKRRYESVVNSSVKPSPLFPVPDKKVKN